MQYIQLGNSNLKVSRICLGCMGFGDAQKGMHSWTLNEAQSTEVIKHALESGINFFDTAMSYQSGTSEMYLGRALKQLAKREDVIVATKFALRTSEEKAAGIDGRAHVINCLNASLERLGMDYVDLYICHMWDYDTPILEIMEGLNDAVRAGKVRAIGISNCYAWQLAKANALAESHGWVKFASVQGHYNLIFREEEREMLPCCREEDVALTPYSALASGRLARLPGTNTKRMEEDTFAKGKYAATEAMDEVIIQRVAELAEKHGVGMTQISLAWLLTKVTSPIVGATKVHHIDGAVAALDVHLTPEEIQYLEELYQPHRLVGVMATNH